MNVLPANQIDKGAAPIDKRFAANERSPEALRRAASQFEALLLRQLTSALNTTGVDEGGEDNLFGGDGGTGLAKQMFSEQLADTMAKSGGIGLADLIMSKFGVNAEKPAANAVSKGLTNAITAVKDIRESNSLTKTKAKASMPLINKSAKALPIERPSFAGDPNDAEVISTFENQMRTEGIDDSMKHLILDGRIVNTTRARIAPNAPINELRDVSPLTATSVSASEKIAYQYPVDGRLSSGFGDRFHPIDHKTKFHAGLDLAVPTGTSVKASAQGVVKFTGWKGGYGNFVVIEHADGKETRYGHLSKILVSEGDELKAGQQIALSGSTGKSTGPHLHFEVRENGQVVNPVKILSNVLPDAAER